MISFESPAPALTEELIKGSVISFSGIFANVNSRLPSQ